jgi:phosphate transport system substrate-binding protein
VKRCSLLLLVVCLGLGTGASAADVILNGAGATFPEPLYLKWIASYETSTTQRISYQAVGSGEGIRQLLTQSVDFGATDAFLSDKELHEATAPILHLPTCLGAVAITYNLPGRPELKFTPELLSGIFLGDITKWSDPRIAKINKGVKFPDLEIRVLHRSDSSGTTFIFSDYLSKVSSTWRKKIGTGKTVRWPTGLGLTGNSKVAEFIQRIPGSIGYVEHSYVKDQDLPTATIRNQAGNFIKPTRESVTAAADVELPDDSRIMITDTRAENGYPISAFTYLIFFKEQAYRARPQARAQALAQFLWWVIHEGQGLTQESSYAPLPKVAVERAERILNSMTYTGEPLLQH